MFKCQFSFDMSFINVNRVMNNIFFVAFFKTKFLSCFLSVTCLICFLLLFFFKYFCIYEYDKRIFFVASFNTKFKEGQFMLSFFIFFINSSQSQVLVCHLFNVSDEAYDVDDENGDDDNNNEVVDVGVICG